jgi:quinol monooxygenase YgiN
MAIPFGMHVRFTAQAGQGDALTAMLLEAADGVRSLDACLLYIVSRVPGDDETVWVTEAWTDRESHDASLKDEQAQALIKRALPLLAGPPEAIELRPAGGKGLPAKIAVSGADPQSD